MDLQEAVNEAVAVRALVAKREVADYGREWTLSDLVVGLITDVGDLARLVAEHQGLRPRRDGLSGAIEHEVADCMWGVFVIADRLGVDVPQAFAEGMDSVRDWATAPR